MLLSLLLRLLLEPPLLPPDPLESELRLV